MVVRWLRAQKGAEFQKAAKVFDEFQGQVDLVAGDDRRFRNPSMNRDGDPGTWVGGETIGNTVLLNQEFPGGDLLINAVHESYHVAGTNAEAPIHAAEWRAYRQMGPRTRSTAPFNAAKFYFWWGRGYGRPLPPGTAEPTP